MKCFLLPLLAIATVATASADELKVVGSDLLGSTIVAPLEAFATSNGIELEVDLFGSIPAMSQLRDDEAQLALIARPYEEGEFKLDGMVIVPFGYQVSFVIVNEKNPLSELTLNQLAGIFGTSSETYYSRWGELGLGDGMATRSIQPIVLSKPDSVILELFKAKALNRSPFKPNIVMIESYDGNSELIAGDSGAIAVFPYLPKDRSLKALSISGSGPDNFAFGPTRENVYYKDYPMSLPFYLVFKKENQAELQELIRFMLSPEVSQALESNGFMPLPENVRKRTILDLDIRS